MLHTGSHCGHRNIVTTRILLSIIIILTKVKMIIRPQPQRLGAYRFGVSVRLSVRLSVIDSFPGCIFVTNSRRDLGIGSYERSWPVDVPFDSFGQIRPPEMAEFGQNVQNSGFSELELFQAVSLQRMVVETWEYAQMKGLGL